MNRNYELWDFKIFDSKKEAETYASLQKKLRWSALTSPAYILKKLRSLDYRQKLIDGMESLEAEISQYCKEYGTDVLMGYKVNRDNGRVTLKKLPV